MKLIHLILVFIPISLFSQESVFLLKKSLPEAKLPYYHSETLPYNYYQENELEISRFPFLIEEITNFIQFDKIKGVQKKYFGCAQLSFDDWFGVIALEEFKNLHDSTAFYKMKFITFNREGQQIDILDFKFHQTLKKEKNGFEYGIETYLGSEIGTSGGKMYITQEINEEITRFEYSVIFEDEPPMVETYFVQSKMIKSVFIIEKNGEIKEQWIE